MIFIYAIALFYATWVFYLAVMNLKRARDAGTLSPVALVMGYPILIAGVVLNAVLNATVMSALFWELPHEWQTTHRLKRHAPTDTWRGKRARWFAKHMLDVFDPSGKHI